MLNKVLRVDTKPKTLPKTLWFLEFRTFFVRLDHHNRQSDPFRYIKWLWRLYPSAHQHMEQFNSAYFFKLPKLPSPTPTSGLDDRLIGPTKMSQLQSFSYYPLMGFLKCLIDNLVLSKIEIPFFLIIIKNCPPLVMIKRIHP